MLSLTSTLKSEVETLQAKCRGSNAQRRRPLFCALYFPKLRDEYARFYNGNFPGQFRALELIVDKMLKHWAAHETTDIHFSSEVVRDDTIRTDHDDKLGIRRSNGKMFAIFPSIGLAIHYSSYTTYARSKKEALQVITRPEFQKPMQL